MAVRVILPIAVLVAGGYAYSKLSVEQEEAKTPPVEKEVLRSKVLELRIGDYAVVIEANGMVQAHNEITLSAQVSGEIIRVSAGFEVGSYFSEGDVLVELDARDYENAVAVAEAERLGAEAAMKLATTEHDRIFELYNNNTSNEVELNQAVAARTQAVAAFHSADAQLSQAKRDLERTTIRAPFAGRVREKAIGLGQSVGPGTSLGVVFAVDFAEVHLPIAARELRLLDLPEMEDDPPVEVKLRDAISKDSETIWIGKIVRTAGALDADSLELFAIARIDDPFGLKSGRPPMRIGQPVVGSIAGKVLTHVVAIPRGAVRQLDQVVLVDKTEMTLMPKTIVPVWSDDQHVIVRDPLIQDGTLLATTHLVYAPSGAKIEIIPDIEMTAAAKTGETAKTESVAN